MKGTGRFALVLLSVVLVVGGFYLIIYSGESLRLDLKHSKEMTPKQMLIVAPLLMEYFFIAFTFICLAAFIKKGFCNIKKEGGVLTGFFLGFLFWFVFGLFFLFCGGGLITEFPKTSKALLLVELFVAVLILGILHGIAGFFMEIKKTCNEPRIGR